MQIRISFRCRSDLVLDADHALDFLSYLVLQVCISFCSVSDKSGVSLFLPCSHKTALAHISTEEEIGVGFSDTKTMDLPLACRNAEDLKCLNVIRAIRESVYIIQAENANRHLENHQRTFKIKLPISN